MKKLVTAVVLLAALLAAAVGMADAEGAIVQSSCNIMPSGEYYLVYTFAQVHNNSDQIICLDQGSFELHDGEQLLSSQKVTRMWPYFLNPGEDGYFFDIVSFEPNEDGSPDLPNVTNIDYNITYMTVNQAFGSYDLSAVAKLVKDELTGGISVICEVTNPTQTDAYDPSVSFGLYTEGGQMIYADGRMLTGLGIPAGGTVLVRFDVEEAFVSQWEAYNAVPTRVRVDASFRQDAD